VRRNGFEQAMCELLWPNGKSPVAVSGLMLVQVCFGHPFTSNIESKAVVCGHSHVTLLLTINKVLKFFTLLPI